MIQAIQYGLSKSRTRFWVGTKLDQMSLQMTSGKCKTMRKSLSACFIITFHDMILLSSLQSKHDQSTGKQCSNGRTATFLGNAQFLFLFIMDQVRYPQDYVIEQVLPILLDVSQNDNRYGRIITTHNLNTLL